MELEDMIKETCKEIEGKRVMLAVYMHNDDWAAEYKFSSTFMAAKEMGIFQEDENSVSNFTSNLISKDYEPEWKMQIKTAVDLMSLYLRLGYLCSHEEKSGDFKRLKLLAEKSYQELYDHHMSAIEKLFDMSW